MRSRSISSYSGSATVEHIGITFLIAALLAAALVAVLARGGSGLGLGETIARRIACGPRAPGPCRQNPVVSAYGWPVARLVRALAPAPLARPDSEGNGLVPVDFRYCRRTSCAIPLPGPRGAHLTVSNRRTTAFTEVHDHRRSGGDVVITYWLYRPGLGWEADTRSAGAAGVEAASHVRVRLSDDPALVPLETLPGRDHYEFPPEERPPWQWRVESRYPGW